MNAAPATISPGQPARAAHMCRERAGVGSRDEICRADAIEGLLARQPLTAGNDFLFHHRDVRRGAAKRGGSEPEEDASNLRERVGFDHPGSCVGGNPTLARRRPRVMIYATMKG